MLFVSARATRTAVIVIALSAAGLWALHAMDARADPPPLDDLSPCAEGRALFAAKLAYLEARISPCKRCSAQWRTPMWRSRPISQPLNATSFRGTTFHPRRSPLFRRPAMGRLLLPETWL
jgi:hypothetical protein